MSSPTDPSGPSQSLGPPMSPEQLAMLPHDDRGPAIIGVAWLLFSLATIFLGLRIMCKTTAHRRMWWDDYVLIASWVAFLVDVAMTTYVVRLGLGKRMWDFPMENLPKFALPIIVRGTFAITSIVWSKTAFSVTLLRLTDGWTRWLVWYILISTNIALGLSALLPWVQCKPLAAAWDITVVGTCWPKSVGMSYNIFSGAYSAAMDFALALLPWKLLMSLNIRRREKFGAAFAMSVGVFAGIAAIVKTTKIPTLYGDDMSESIELVFWDLTETGVTIIAASIPALRVLLRDAGTMASKSGGSHEMPTSRNRTAPSASRSRVAHTRKHETAIELSQADTPYLELGDSSSDKSVLQLQSK